MAVGIILLFIGIAVQPSIAICDTYTNDVDNELEGKSENGTHDEYKEIITFIKGFAELNWIKRRGYFRGEVNITWDTRPGRINLFGFRRSDSGIEYYNELITEGFVYINYFIGFSSGISFPEFAPGILGIALGNIDWYK